MFGFGSHNPGARRKHRALLSRLHRKHHVTASNSPGDVKGEQMQLTNQFRKSQGRSALSWSNDLASSAQWKADDMSQHSYMNHDERNGDPWYKKIYQSLGNNNHKVAQNIGEGFSTSSSIETAWENSPEHRRNLLDPGLKHIGVGYNSNGGYWCQNFSD